MTTFKERITEPIKEAYERGYDNNVAQARLKWYPHWMKVCGVETAEEIDFANPIVSLEWKLCDISTQAKLTSGDPALREKVLASFTDDER